LPTPGERRRADAVVARPVEGNVEEADQAEQAEPEEGGTGVAT
jgi:hypothetical protein